MKDAIACDIASHSFAGSTRVLMADGTSKPISDVKVGDQVADADPNNDRTPQNGKVTAVHVTDDDRDFVDLLMNTPTGTESVTATVNHLFWDETSEQWTPSVDLRVGDRLEVAGGRTAEIGQVKVRVARERTYDLTVDVLHTYYVLVGAVPVLVHNESCRAKVLSDPLPQNMSTAIVNAYDDIRAGNGVAEIDPATGMQGIFRGNEDHLRQWAGALEWRVPGAQGNQTRILEMTLPDGRKVMGWTTDHYKTVKKFSAPHFPDDGWNK